MYCLRIFFLLAVKFTSIIFIKFSVLLTQVFKFKFLEIQNVLHPYKVAIALGYYIYLHLKNSG